MSDTNALRGRIADELDRQASDIIGSPSLSVGLIVNREINAAIKHYESTRFRWNEVREATLATTVSGTRVYSLTANFLSMDTLKVAYNGSYVPIIKATWQEIDERDRDVTGVTGLPVKFAIYGNVVRLFPVPNGAYTLFASYIRRFPPTSLTGSYCALIPVGGGYTLSTTSTASHNNRIDGWTTDGEELIRARGKAAVQINYLREPDAMAEFKMLFQSREPFLSVAERLAYERLADETNDILSSGRIKGYGF